jgi:putative transposase
MMFARAGPRAGSRRAWVVAARACDALHRPEEVLCVGGNGLSVYRLLKAHDLITSPAFIVMKAADEFKDKTTAPNQLRQTDFTYLKVIGWGWFNLSTILDDFSRYIIAWKLCTTMKAEDVTDTLELALGTSGIETARVVHRPRLLSDNSSSYLSADLAKWLDDRKMQHVRGAPYHPMTQGKIERWH